MTTETRGTVQFEYVDVCVSCGKPNTPGVGVCTTCGKNQFRREPLTKAPAQTVGTDGEQPAPPPLPPDAGAEGEEPTTSYLVEEVAGPDLPAKIEEKRAELETEWARIEAEKTHLKDEADRLKNAENALQAREGALEAREGALRTRVNDVEKRESAVREKTSSLARRAAELDTKALELQTAEARAKADLEKKQREVLDLLTRLTERARAVREYISS